jgi:phospholipid transport system transporter-binding protein
VASIVQQNGRLIVSGDLNFSTVVKLWRESLPLFSSLGTLDFDLSNVRSSNSAGVALMIEWVKYAKNKNQVIKFIDVPQQLESIILAAGIKKIL